MSTIEGPRLPLRASFDERVTRVIDQLATKLFLPFESEIVERVFPLQETTLKNFTNVMEQSVRVFSH